MPLLPQLLGYEPFTYTVARQWYPSSVWDTLDFRLLNFRITYVWSFIFFGCFLSSYLGRGKPLCAIIIPFAFCLGIGLTFSKMYSNYYLKRKYRVSAEAAATVSNTADQLIESMPKAFNPEAARDLEAEIQFHITGEGEGNWVVAIGKGKCEVRRGVTFNPSLTIESPGEVWVKIARGEIDRPKALMQGLYKVKGDMKILAQMAQLFGARYKAP